LLSSHIFDWFKKGTGEGEKPLNEIRGRTLQISSEQVFDFPGKLALE